MLHQQITTVPAAECLIANAAVSKSKASALESQPLKGLQERRSRMLSGVLFAREQSHQPCYVNGGLRGFQPTLGNCRQFGLRRKRHLLADC